MYTFWRQFEESCKNQMIWFDITAVGSCKESKQYIFVCLAQACKAPFSSQYTSLTFKRLHLLCVKFYRLSKKTNRLPCWQTYTVYRLSCSGVRIHRFTCYLVLITFPPWVYSLEKRNWRVLWKIFSWGLKSLILHRLSQVFQNFLEWFLAEHHVMGFLVTAWKGRANSQVARFAR